MPDASFARGWPQQAGTPWVLRVRFVTSFGPLNTTKKHGGGGGGGGGGVAPGVLAATFERRQIRAASARVALTLLLAAGRIFGGTALLMGCANG